MSGVHLHFETRIARERPTTDTSTSTPVDPITNFFPLDFRFVFEESFIAYSDHFSIFVYTREGEYFTLENLSIMDPSDLEQLDIMPESIAEAIELLGFDVIARYIENLAGIDGLHRSSLVNTESIQVIADLFLNR